MQTVKSLFFFLCLVFLLCAYDASFFATLGHKLKELISTPSHQNLQKAPYTGPAFSVATEQAAALQVVDHIRYTTNLVPHEEFFVYFRVGGYIADIYSIPQSNPIHARSTNTVDAECGDKVHKGDILVQLRTIDYQNRLAAARETLKKALARSRQASLDLERYYILLENKAMARSDFDTFVEHVDAVKAREEAARSNFTQAMEQLRNTALFSPIDGIITQKYVQRGMLAVADSVAYAIGDYSRMKAVFIVPDSMAKQVHVGATLAVSLGTESGQESIEGQITAISPLSWTQRPLCELELSFDNSHALMQDVQGVVSLLWQDNGLIMEEQEDIAYQAIPAVPMSAIVRARGQENGHAVFIVEKRVEATGENNCYARECLVEIGRVQGDKVELVSGIHMGDDVVVLGAERLFDGAPVHLLPKVNHKPYYGY